MQLLSTSIRLCAVAALWTVAFSCTADLWAEDWREFRGASHGVLSKGNLPIEWSPTKNIRWRTELPGQGWSSPIVVGNVVYLTAAVPKPESKMGLELVLFLLDLRSGDLLKTVQLFTHDSELASKMHSKNSQASPTPVAVGNRIFIHFGHLGTCCVDLQGKIIWRNEDLSYAPVHGNGGSPVVVDNRMIFTRDGETIHEITALDTETGKIAWQRDRDVEATKYFSFCTPTLIEVGPERQLICPGSNVVQSINPADGSVRWFATYEGYSVVPRPIYANGLVYICTGYDRPSLLAIDPTGHGDVTESHIKWKADSNIPNTPSLVSYQSDIVMVNDRGIASCLDGRTGKEIWRERIGGNFSASPILIQNRIYLFSEEGDTTILELAEKPRELAKNKLGERCLATPAVADGDLLLRTAKGLYRIHQDAN